MALENRVVWKIWLLVNTQWRVSGLSPIGLDFPAVIQIADIFGIEITPAFFQKLKILELAELERFRKEVNNG